MTAALASELTAAFAAKSRVLLGIAGPPGGGKSTLAAALARALDGVVVALDGFHFTNAELAARDLLSRKGSPPTFHVGALVNKLQRLRAGFDTRVPVYSRTLHEPVPDAVRIGPGVKFVFVEGNYLLLPAEPWCSVHRLLDACWYLDVPLGECLRRVRARHVAGGASEPEADRKLRENDRPNAELIIAHKLRADRVIDGATMTQ